MSETFPEVCYECYPERDPRTYVPRLCTTHAPGVAGEDDTGIQHSYLAGSADIDAETNRRWCALIHRPKTSQPA